MSFFSKLKAKITGQNREAYYEGFSETNKKFGDGLRKLLGLKANIDDDFYQALMQVLLASDVGQKTSIELLNQLKKRVKAEHIDNSSLAVEALTKIILDQFKPFDSSLKSGLNVLLMVGVNGSGKTTSCAKLAHFYQQQGKKVMLVAADTFRAAAVEQLETWAKHIDVPCVKGKEQADPASVVVDACKKALQDEMDVLIIDTAGRLQNKVNLMTELEKIHRVVEKTTQVKPQQTFLVLDASTGQNAIAQAEAFVQSADVNGIICTKMEGTAKGGVLIALAALLKLPVAYIGLGEKVDDLKVFDPGVYLEAITAEITHA